MPLKLAAAVLAAACLLSALLLAIPAPTTAAEEEVKRQLSHIKGNVWRFKNKFNYSVVIETEEGVVVTDPITRGGADWLKEIIASRFAKPIIYLVYSHSNEDHSYGGWVFTDTAKAIAHENAPASALRLSPDIRFSERMTFQAGKHSFELTYLGPGIGEDMIAMVIRPENVAFIVDVVSPRRLPVEDFPGIDIAELIEQIKAVEALDFQVMAPGHSVLGTKADATALRTYIEWLRDAVAAELAAGKSVDQIVDDLDTSAYEDWLAYDVWRHQNIRGMARWLKESGLIH